MSSDYVLKNAYLHITNACEYKCPFCYAEDIKFVNGKNYFSLEEIKAVIDKISLSTIENLSLVGGNPLLHPYIDEIIEYVKLTTNLKITLMTNTADFFSDKLKKIRTMIDILMVTIHSDSAEEHDKLTKVPGSYYKLINCLKEFQCVSPHSKIKIAMNITPYAYDKIYTAVERIIENGIQVDEIILQRIAPVSLDKMNEIYLVDADKANEALTQARQVRDNLNVKIDLVDPFPLCFVNEENRNVVVPCKCGKTDINLNGKGDVSRCGADPNYQLGNIFKTSIEKIWSSKQLQSFRKREYLPQECIGCSEKIICGGGCPMSVITYKALGKSHLDMFRKK